jgi:hypothetical protein
MDQVFATYQQGQVILDSTVDWPNGTRIAVTPVETQPVAQRSDKTVDQPSAAEFEDLLDELGDIVDASAGADRLPLSDYAVSRRGIYEEHL